MVELSETEAPGRTAATTASGSSVEADAAALRVEDLSITFGGIAALREVSFSVAPGGRTAIIGQNGAGKTTLLNCISGIYRGRGQAYVDGVAIGGKLAHARPAFGVARTFQTPTLLDTESVVDNVMLGLFSQTRSSGFLPTALGLPQVTRAERSGRDRVLELLDILGIAGLAKRSVAGLPHRQRRLVEIARALANEPRVLMLDEPAAGSHHSEAVDLMERVQSVCADRVAIVLVEHNARLVMDFAEQVVVLNFGEVLAIGTPAEIRRDPAVISAYLGEAVL